MNDYPEPEDVLPFYERELALLRRSMREFSERYPKEAARLGISGEHCDDPHVERILQSAALSNARTAAHVEDDYPEVPNEMLERLHPEVLRPFPACSSCTASLRKRYRLRTIGSTVTSSRAYRKEDLGRSAM